MPEIKVSQATFNRLKELAEPLVDSADTVIGRLIEFYEVNGAKAAKQLSKAAPDRQRARSGEFTPNEDFLEPLVQVLRKAGGELPAGDAINAVGDLMGDRLNEVDRAQLPSGEVRWRNNVRWASNRLKKNGKLDPEAPFGTWRLAK
jgi:hypothetical protein